MRFDEKLAIYEFLTNEGTYNDKLPLYKEKLMSYPDEITEQCYGLLISSSIPFPSKMLVLCALRDLYSESTPFVTQTTNSFAKRSTATSSRTFST